MTRGKAMSDSAVMRLPVDEYRNMGLRVSVTEWDSLTECAVHHGVKQKTIKNLIHFGGSLDGLTTFDIPATCSMNTRLKAGKAGATVIEIYNEKTGARLDGGASRRRVIAKGARA